MHTRTLTLLLTLLLIAVLGAIWWLKHDTPQATPPRDYREIHQEGILRIITEYSPAAYYAQGDSLAGFQYELIRALSNTSGLEIQTNLDMNLTSSYQALNTNQADLIARSFPLQSDLQESYLFTQPITSSHQVLIQRTAAANNQTEPIRRHTDLEGKTIHLPQNSPAIQRLHNLEYEIGGYINIIQDNQYATEQLIIRVAKGEIDYTVSDLHYAELLQKELPQIDIQTDIGFTQLQCWMLRKNSPILLDSLNHWLDRIHQSGEYDKIYKRYYGVTY